MNVRNIKTGIHIAESFLFAGFCFAGLFPFSPSTVAASRIDVQDVLLAAELNAMCERALYSDPQKLGDFLHNHFDNLVRDIAKGGGEHLTALAQLIGVPVRERAVFASVLQRHFTQLFPDAWPAPQIFVRQMTGFLNSYHIAYHRSRTSLCSAT